MQGATHFIHVYRSKFDGELMQTKPVSIEHLESFKERMKNYDMLETSTIWIGKHKPKPVLVTLHDDTLKVKVVEEILTK